MEQIIAAVIPVVIIGVICAAVLVIASKLMAVKEDERFPKIRECLPGANCGACGFAGCDGYAKALCGQKDTPANLCVPGGKDTALQLSEILGIECKDVEKLTAFVHCSGDCHKTEDKSEYRGLYDFKAAKLDFGGQKTCSFDCMGLGDCASVCPQGAICITEGIARVNPRLCIGCGLCTKACPNHLITLLPEHQAAAVCCNNKEKGAQTRKICAAGCIGCKKCERTCPLGAVKVIDNVAVIDSSLCKDCPDPGICVKGCPVKAITELMF